MPAGSDDYSSLRILGKGVRYTRNRLELEVPGVSEDMATREIGVEIPGRFLTTYADAWHAAQAAVVPLCMPDAKIGFQARGINRLGDIGSYRHATDADFEADYAGMTTDQWDALYAGQTVDDWDEAWLAKTREDFTNQAFGNVAGARMLMDGSWYRITSATTTSGTTGGTAAVDTTDADFEAVWAGRAIEEWDAVWAGRPVEDWEARPLEDA